MILSHRIVIYLLACFILMTPNIFAESNSISGKVSDSKTGIVIQGASIYIPELNTGTISDETGTFSLKNIPDGGYSVRASFVGYAPSTLNLKLPGNSVLEFSLNPAPLVTEEIVSTARGRQTRLNDIPGSVEVLTDEDIRETNPVSIPAALSRKAGIAVSSDMPWSSRPVIRGLTGDQVVMLVDGNRVVTATTLPAQYGTIANGDIERIEVLKGPISVLYGSGSTGGVVNIITKKGRFSPEHEFNWGINPTYESAANGLSSNERIGISNSTYYFSLSQSNRRYKDYLASDNTRIQNSQFQDRQTQANFGLKLSDHHILEARYQNFSALDVGIPGGDAFPVTATARYPKTTRLLADAAWTWRPALSWLKESRVNVYYQPVERRVKLEPNTTPPLQAHPTDDTKQMRMTPLALYPNADHNVYGARWQNVLESGSHTIVTGIEGWQKHMVSDRTKEILREIYDKETGSLVGEPSIVTIIDTPVPESWQRPIGLFAEDSFGLGRKTKFTLGGRIDQIHTENKKSYLTDQPVSDVLLWDARNDNDISWSLVAGAVHKTTEAFNFNFTVARSFRSPTIEERYLYADLGGKLTVGDPGIDSENGTFVEGGFSALLGTLRLSGQVFVNSLNDMVILKPGGEFNGRPADVYDNAGKALLWGYESGLDWAVFPRLLFQADISYVRGTDEELDTDLPAMPPLKAHIGSRWGFTKDLWIEPLVTLVDKQNKVAVGETKTAGYVLVDLSAGKSIMRTGDVTHDLVIGVKNMGDKLYRDHLTVSRGYDVYGMGRSFYVSWRVNYSH
ncbi:MAG: TonB-dependent receptor [Candidatus Latescibacteria bacterium]|nr:TonB-dependent receptor [Candidatus Latescibacterota bacterium]